MKKKHKIILIVIVVIIVVAVGNRAYNYIINDLPANIHLRDNSIDEEKTIIILKNGNRWCWDTGSSGSLLCNYIEHKKLKIGYSWSTDSKNEKRRLDIFFAKTLSTDYILLENFIYNYIEKSNISHNLQNLNIVGILGMNVIKNYNWLLDFKQNTLSNFDKIYIYSALPELKLKYKSKLYPYSSIEIEGIKLKNTLIDSGSDADIQLLPSDIEQINKIIPPDSIIEQFSSGLFSDSIPSKKYFYSRLKVNGLFIDTLTINESKKRKLGIGFFRKFDCVFWDSGSKEVRFYRD